MQPLTLVVHVVAYTHQVMGSRDEIMSCILWRDQAALRDSINASPTVGELLAEFQKFHTRLFSDVWINRL